MTGRRDGGTVGRRGSGKTAGRWDGATVGWQHSGTIFGQLAAGTTFGQRHSALPSVSESKW